MSTDSIADMLTRIRNANTAGHSRVALPASRVMGPRLPLYILSAFHYLYW